MGGFYPARKIEPYRLWVGSKQDSRNVTAASRHGVTLVVNCTRDLPFVLPGVRQVRVPVHDHPDESDDMLEHLPAALKAIDEELRRGGTVLVHCFAGVSRSASVVAAYLMFREGLTPRQAIARVQALKPETFGSDPNFLDALETLHGALKKTQ